MVQQDGLRNLRRGWRLISLCILLGVIVAGAVTANTTPLYQVQSILLMSASPRGDDPATAFQGGSFAQLRVKSYSQLVPTPAVLEPVISQLGLTLTSEQLARKISVTNPVDTALLRIAVTDPKATVARDVANAVAIQFSRLLRTLETPEGARSALVKASVVKAADTPNAPVSPRATFNLGLGLIFGLMMGVGITVLREHLGTVIPEVLGGADVIGRLPPGRIPDVLGRFQLMPSWIPRRTVPSRDERSPMATEAYHALRATVISMVAGPPRLLQVTGAGGDEDSGAVAVQLAAALVHTGAEPVLVCLAGCPPRPVAGGRSTDRQPGSVEFFSGGVDLLDVLEPDLVVSGLCTVSCRNGSPPGARLLAEPSAEKAVKELRATGVDVIVHTRSMHGSFQAIQMARLVDTTLLTARLHSRAENDVAQATSSLAAVGAPVMGVVLT